MITRRDFLKISVAGGALASLGNVAEAKHAVGAVLPDDRFCYESARRIPVLAEVDLVVAGGSTRAVAAAVAAARNGCRVFLIGYMPYFGDDICGTLFLERREEELLQTALARKLFFGKELPSPLHIKKVLEDELIDHNVQFLYSSYVTNMLVASDDGTVSGVVIVNRSGRQAIRCKAVIDATHDASLAKLMDVPCTPFLPGKKEFIYTVVGNTKRENLGIIRAEILPQPVVSEGKSYPVTRYTFRYELKENSYAALEDAEQWIRSLTWDADQVDSSDLLWYIPEQTIRSERAYEGDAVSLRQLPLEAFKPKGTVNLWVLGPYAEINRAVVARVMRPVPSLFLGELLGEQVATRIQELPMSHPVVVRQPKVNASNQGKVGEQLSPLRPLLQKEQVESPAGALPILGSYDVVVMGGGTAGASAGISAAKQGANTLVLEYLHGLGGLSTLGMIGVYWDGFRGGYTEQVDRGVLGMAPEGHPRQPHKEGHFPADWKMEWYRRQLLEAGGKLWFGVIGCGALSENGKVKGVVVATPFGRGIVLAKVVIDSTGSADIAIAAGAGFDYTGKNTLAVQGAGTGKWSPGDYYNNNDWLFVDDTDILDVSRAFVQAKSKLAGVYDLVKIPQTRERRRVIGDYTISVYDVINHRRYSDTISYHKSSFDTHGMIIDPFFLLNPPEKRHTIYDADVPLRSLLPKGLEGILITGLGASAHRDAMPVIRMQPCLQNQGYAVGYLAALSVQEGKMLRQVDIKRIQRHLVKIGNLPERVLKDKEFKGFSGSEMKKAAAEVTDHYKGLEVLLTDTDSCLRLLRKQMETEHRTDERILLASILCMLGDGHYASLLGDAIRQYVHWDTGWDYTGMGQFGSCLSRLDTLVMALGNSRDQAFVSVLLKKARILEPEDSFSHFRAISMAAESIGSRESIPVLAGMLSKPGVRHHSISSFAEARNCVVPDMNDTSTRNLALKELHLARALYLCGDLNRMGQSVLERYANGLQGHYARFAYEILDSKKKVIGDVEPT